MSKKKGRGISRREFVKLAGHWCAGSRSGTSISFSGARAAQQKTLKILQWSHFVPAYDTWFNGTFTKEWGQKNNTNVVVDNINLVDLGTRSRVGSIGEEGPRPFHVPLPAGGLRERDDRYVARVPGSGEEARQEN